VDFPVRLPDRLRLRLPPGVSLFPRPKRRRWILSLAPDWHQETLPAVVVTCEEAVAHVEHRLASSGEDPGAAMRRRTASGPTVGECADRWLALLEKDDRCAPATLKGHRGNLKNWIRPKFGQTPIAELEVPALRAWLREQRAAHPEGARTILHVVSTFTGLVDAALADGWLTAPANILRHPGVRTELPEADDREPVCLPPELVQQLLDAPVVPLERRARYVIAFTSGMRDGEIAGIRLDRLDRETTPRAVRIEDAVALVGAKGPRGFAKPKAPKTKSSRRTLPVHAAADAAISEWLAEGWERLVGRPPRPDDYLFPRPDGQPSRPRSAELLREDLRAAGLPDAHDGRAIELKASRSSFLTWLDEAGVDERIRKRLAGHRATDVTERHYTHRELQQLAAAVDKIPLTWTAGRCTVQATVQGCTVNADSSMNSAPPRRLERPTNGLGNRCSIH
jgi:integrase